MRYPAIRGMLWLVVSILLACSGASALRTRDHLFGEANVRYMEEVGGYTAKELKALRGIMAENDAAGYVAGWAQAQSVRVSYEKTGGSQTADVIYVDGDPSLIINVTILTGVLPSMDGGADCAIDRKTALLLFGSIDVAGETMRVGAKDLKITGVFELPDRLPALRADPGRGLVFVDYSEAPEATLIASLGFSARGAVAVAKVSEWMDTAGLSMRGTLSDDSDQRALFVFFGSIPAYLLAAMTVWRVAGAFARRTIRLRRSILALRNDPYSGRRELRRVGLRHAIGFAALVAIASAAVLFAPGMPRIPPVYLPTRWSDFGFYASMFRASMEAAAQKAFSVALRPWLFYDRLTTYCQWLPLLSLPALALANRRIARAQPACMTAAPAALGICTMLAAPASLWIAGRAGFVPAFAPGMLVLPALWIMISLYLKGDKV
ncbi:MAG: ABC transporter permease [Clostridia bacterium]|nr:ABC transporter permease [Clostridia bacterium]